MGNNCLAAIEQHRRKGREIKFDRENEVLTKMIQIWEQKTEREKKHCEELIKQDGEMAKAIAHEIRALKAAASSDLALPSDDLIRTRLSELLMHRKRIKISQLAINRSINKQLMIEALSARLEENHLDCETKHLAKAIPSIAEDPDEIWAKGTDVKEWMEQIKDNDAMDQEQQLLTTAEDEKQIDALMSKIFPAKGGGGRREEHKTPSVASSSLRSLPPGRLMPSAPPPTKTVGAAYVVDAGVKSVNVV